MPVSATLAVGLAASLDVVAEEFPRDVHPVSLFGRLLGTLDREWTYPRVVGTVGVLGLSVVVSVFLAGVVALAGRIDPLVAGIAAGLVLFTTTSLRMLLRLASEVIAVSDTDLQRAREQLPSLVGRDPDDLSPGEIRSAAVESAAENLADGLVGPLFAFALVAPVSLPLATGTTVFVKAVNTADSMLGYRSKPVGWGAATFDDVLMWVPARLTALLLAISAGDCGAVWRARLSAGETASPNSGWPMATMAATLDIRLEKPGAYVLFPDVNLPSVTDANRAIRIALIAGALSILTAGVVAWL